MKSTPSPSFAAVLSVALAAVACGNAPGAASPAAGRPDDATSVRALEESEDEVLRDLSATDRRFAARARITPADDDLRRVAMTAVFADDPTLAVVDGVVDPFSFDARARGLEAAKKRLATAPRALPRRASGLTPEPALERELLVRMVDEEQLRLEDERRLPRSASELVRAIVETWTSPKTPDLVASRDRWLTRRLSEVRASLGAGGPGLDVVRARELDDALDALERLIDTPGLNGATAELVKLREALEAQGARPPARPFDDWREVEKRVKAHLGVASDAASLASRLAAAESQLRASAEGAIASSRIDADVLASRVSAAMFDPSPCVDAVVGSRVRSMAPPPERRAICRLRHALATATDDASRAVALATMHDEVVVARWAIAAARGEGTIDALAGKHPPLVRPSPDVSARLERAALARPVASIGAGLAAAILVEGDAPAERARAWTRLGEVPLDLAERALGPAAPKKTARAE